MHLEDNRIKGLVKNVSEKNKGILLFTPEGENWWNLLGDKIKITKRLKGKEVELSIVNLEKHSFSYLEVTKENVQEKDDYWAKRLERDIQQDRYRGKGAALNTAIEIIKAKKYDLTGHTDQEVLDRAIILAQDIIKWIEK